MADGWYLHRVRLITVHVSVKSVDSENLRHEPAALAAIDLHDEINQIADFRLNGLVRYIHIGTKRQAGQPGKRL